MMELSNRELVALFPRASQRPENVKLADGQEWIALVNFHFDRIEQRKRARNDPVL